MNVNTLSSASSFNPGSQLWILPDKEHSLWMPKVDWYLNFQNSKVLAHQWSNRASSLEKINEITELNIQSTTPQSFIPSNIMIPAEKYLPCKWVIIIPFGDNLEHWVSQSFKHWSRLKTDSLRVFLPPNIQPHEFSQIWRTHDETADLTLVNNSL